MASKQQVKSTAKSVQAPKSTQQSKASPAPKSVQQPKSGAPKSAATTPKSTASKAPPPKAQSQMSAASAVKSVQKSAIDSVATQPVAPGMMPTPEQVAMVPGAPVSEEELAKLQAAGSLPAGITVGMLPTMHKVKSGDEEILVLMLDAPPCGCRKVDGKRKRCRLHRKERRDKKKKKAKKNLAKDDDSDRKKLAALRHAEDSGEEEDKPIEGAITPDAIAKWTNLGVGVLIPIDKEGNECAGPRGNEKVDKVKGILVKGPQDCPQFIPEDKIPKDEKGNPKFEKYATGQMIKNEKGQYIFFADKDCQPDEKANPTNLQTDGVDAAEQAKVGATTHQAGIVDINENGMPEFRQIDEQHAAPQDKLATVGVLAKVGDQVVFVQTKGQTVGSGDNGVVIPTTKEGPVAPGTVLGDVVMQEGKVTVVPVGKAPAGATPVGTVVQGDYNQPVMVPYKDTACDKGGVTIAAAEAPKMKETEWKEVIKKEETNQNQFIAATKEQEITAQSKITGKSPETIRKEMTGGGGNDNKDAGGGAAPAQEVVSQAFGGYGGAAAPYDPNKSVFYSPAAAAAAKAAAAKQANNQSQFASGGNAGGGGKDAGSVFLG